MFFYYMIKYQCTYRNSGVNFLACTENIHNTCQLKCSYNVPFSYHIILITDVTGTPFVCFKLLYHVITTYCFLVTFRQFNKIFKVKFVIFTSHNFLNSIVMIVEITLLICNIVLCILTKLPFSFNFNMTV